ncbi:hypothetical protein GCM10009555_104160 [Acrocarpospora macrocephala]|uniref:Uncharacterized protein n=2 Tax=Acrocarpospora macrocephala TaxID=150177 RepID=A0A5M3X735_9ACTN|nr:hypothetical protein Amac_104880 [Acrocarpospora macrocephala]
MGIDPAAYPIPTDRSAADGTLTWGNMEEAWVGGRAGPWRAPDLALVLGSFS